MTSQAIRISRDHVTWSVKVSVGLLLIVFLTLSRDVSPVAGSCSLAKQWRGRWYQGGGRGEVIIRQSTISDRGICHQQQGDFYMMHNRQENCFYCFLILERHRNIIQYKETTCLKEDSMQKLCAHIRVDEVLHTLVRDQHNAVSECPLQEAYYFSYRDVTHGTCDTPTSYVKPCVDRQQLKFHYRHCNSQALYHNLDTTLRCIGSWRDGSDNYFYGKLDETMVRAKDDAYRCFKYSMNGNDVSLSMTLDSSCRGLDSSDAGPFHMDLTRDTGWPRASCQYPGVLRDRSEWADVGGRSSFSTQDGGDVMVQMTRKKPRAKPRLHTRLTCVDTSDSGVTSAMSSVTSSPVSDSTSKLWHIVSFTTQDCISRRQCVAIRSLSNDVVLLSVGSLDDSVTMATCTKLQHYKQNFILTGQSTAVSTCPHRGLYRLALPSSACEAVVAVGCYNSSRLLITGSCFKRAIDAQCLGSWKDGQTTHYALRDEVTPYVLQFHMSSGNFSVDAAWTTGRDQAHFKQLHMYRIKKFSGACDGEQLLTDKDTGSSFINSTLRSLGRPNTVLGDQQPDYSSRSETPDSNNISPASRDKSKSKAKGERGKGKNNDKDRLRHTPRPPNYATNNQSSPALTGKTAASEHNNTRKTTHRQRDELFPARKSTTLPAGPVGISPNRNRTFQSHSTTPSYVMRIPTASPRTRLKEQLDVVMVTASSARVMTSLSLPLQLLITSVVLCAVFVCRMHMHEA